MKSLMLLHSKKIETIFDLIPRCKKFSKTVRDTIVVNTFTKLLLLRIVSFERADPFILLWKCVGSGRLKGPSTLTPSRVHSRKRPLSTPSTMKIIHFGFFISLKSKWSSIFDSRPAIFLPRNDQFGFYYFSVNCPGKRPKRDTMLAKYKWKNVHEGKNDPNEHLWNTSKSRYVYLC